MAKLSTIGFDAGGATDILARVLARQMEKPFGYPITVINQAGGGGTVAMSHLNQHRGDGRYLLIVAPTLITNS